MRCNFILPRGRGAFEGDAAELRNVEHRFAIVAIVAEGTREPLRRARRLADSNLRQSMPGKGYGKKCPLTAKSCPLPAQSSRNFVQCIHYTGVKSTEALAGRADSNPRYTR